MTWVTDLRLFVPLSNPSTRRFLALSVSFALAACGGGGGSDPGGAGPSEPQVGTVSVSPGSVSLEVGQTQQLSATVQSTTGSTMSGVAIFWASSDGTVASVDQSGLVTGVGDGNATITASASGRTGQSSVEVLPALRRDTVMVTEAGGTFPLLDGAVTLSVPTGAVAAATEITTEAIETDSGGPYVPGTHFRFGPDGLAFAELVTMTIAFDTAQIPDTADAHLVRLHRVSTGTPELVLGSRLNLDTGEVSGLVDGFSDFAGQPVTLQNLMAGLAAMAFAMAEGDQRELEILQDAFREDVKAVYIPMNEMCLATSYLDSKASLLSHLSKIKTLVVSATAGLEDLIELTESPCGGLDDPDKTDIEVGRNPLYLGVGVPVQLQPVIRGPSGEELEGELVWGVHDTLVATVTDQGEVTGVEEGKTTIGIVSKDLDLVTGFVEVFVLPDLVLEPSPTQPILPMGRDSAISVMLTDTASGHDVSSVPITWTIGDDAILTQQAAGEGPPATLTVHPEGLGDTFVQACAVGFGPGSCVLVPVAVVLSVEGTWEYQESLTVDLPPPWTETCGVNGVMTVSQSGRSYSGTATETAICTFNPGNGLDPVADTISGEGEISGSIDGSTFSHLGEFDSSEGTEWCRTEGTLSAGTEPGFARSTTGTVSCIDHEDWVSTGTSQGTWLNSVVVGFVPGVQAILALPAWMGAGSH